MRSGWSVRLRRRAVGLIVLLLLSSAACSRNRKLEIDDIVVSDATRLAYKQRCASCHGDAGDGRGGEASKLPVVVPDWTDSTVQSQVSDDMLRVVIVGGGKETGRSHAMPPYPDLADKPILDEMVALIRSFN